MNIVHDTAPSAPPKIGQIFGLLKLQKAGGRMQEAINRRQEAGGGRR